MYFYSDCMLLLIPVTIAKCDITLDVPADISNGRIKAMSFSNVYGILFGNKVKKRINCEQLLDNIIILPKSFQNITYRVSN